MRQWCLLIIFAYFVGINPAFGEQQLTAIKVSQNPVVDGKGDDLAWARAPMIMTQDKVTGTQISLKAVHGAGEVFLRVQFPDKTEDREHKTMIWNEEMELYQTGPTREDSFVFKWNMEANPINLTLSSDTPYKTDIWFWKAFRTDHAGYADDKMHLYSASRIPNAKKIISNMGRIFYLIRPGDKGIPAYQAAIHDEFIHKKMPKFIFRPPTGSRADVRAKGRWHDEKWTIEFRRKLQTNHVDDVPFNLKGHYQFGVSIYEIAGRKKDPNSDKPLFGAGEVGETLILVFKP